MTEAQRRAFTRQSETRQALNLLQRADEPDGQALEKARREFDDSEAEVRAALATDDDETIEVSEIDAETRERSEIRGRARVAAYVGAAADQQPLTGAEHELSAAYGLPAGHMPIDMLLAETREGGEVRAVTPGVTAPGAATPISPVIFEGYSKCRFGGYFPCRGERTGEFSGYVDRPDCNPGSTVVVSSGNGRRVQTGHPDAYPYQWTV